MDELARRVEALAAMAEEAGGVGLGVEVEEECPVDHCKTSVEDVEAVLELSWRNKRENTFHMTCH